MSPGETGAVGGAGGKAGADGRTRPQTGAHAGGSKMVLPTLRNFPENAGPQLLLKSRGPGHTGLYSTAGLPTAGGTMSSGPGRRTPIYRSPYRLSALQLNITRMILS